MKSIITATLAIAMLALAGCRKAEPQSESSATGHFYYGSRGKSGFAAIMAEPRHQALREDLLQRARELCDPASPHFINPDDVDGTIGSLTRSPKMLPFLLGRVLSGAAETLGPAADLTGEAAFAQHGAKLLTAMAQAYPVDGPMLADAETLCRGEFARGMGMAYVFFAEQLDAEKRGMVANEGRKYVESLLQEAEEPAWFYPNSNWTAVTIGGAGVLALALQKDFPDEAPGWVKRCAKLVGDYLSHAYGAEGDYVEHAYLEYAMVNMATFAAALAADGDRTLIDHPHLMAMGRWRVFNSLPGGTALDPLNSSPYRRPGDQETIATPWPLLLAREHGNRELIWLWENSNRAGNDFPLVPWKHSSTRGLSPLRAIWEPDESLPQAPPDVPAYGYFSGRGLAIWRGGTAKDAFFFSIDASKAHSTTHDHADAGSFNLYSGGIAWATDAGKGDRGNATPSDGNSHSIVQIAGKSQAFTGGGLTSGGEVLSQEDHARFGRVTIDATEAYNFSLERILHTGKVEARKVHQDTAAGARHAIRHAVVLKDSDSSPWAVVILDDIRKDDAPHAFVWQMVTEAAHTVRIDGARATLESGAESLDVFAASPAGGTWAHAPLPLREGHASTPPLAALRFETVAANPEFAVVLIPRRPGMAEPVVSFGQSDGEPRIHIRRSKQAVAIRWAGEGSGPKPQPQSLGVE